MRKLHFEIFIIIFLLIIFGCKNSSGSDDDKNNAAVIGYTDDVNILNDDLGFFIQIYQEWETADFSSMSIEEVKQLTNNYITSGETFVASMEKVIAHQTGTGKKALEKSIYDGPSCKPIDFVPGTYSGLSPALAKAVGDLIAETKGEVEIIENKHDNNEIDDNTYYAALNQLKITKSLKAVNVGAGAIAGTGAAIVTGLAIGASAPILVTVAATTIAGVAIGSTVTWFCNW